jgi:cysteine-rich repeat protein
VRCRWGLIALVAGCVTSDLVPCEDGRACPVGTVCDEVHHGCVDPDQVATCTGVPDFTDCSSPKIGAGRCFDGICLPAGCGNALREPEELCDDGNNVGNDGCSAECTSLEVCGDGFADPRFGEACDDGDRENHDGCTAQCGFEDLVWSLRGSTPDPRRLSTVGYDPHRRRVVMFGGFDELDEFRADTWEWNGHTWSVVIPLVQPIPRAGAAMAYDPIRGRMVLFGGLASTGLLNDTWEWDGATWHVMRPLSAPLSRAQHAMAWDPLSKRIVMTGGDAVLARLNDTWTWDGTTWTLVTLLPTPRTQHALVTDPVRGRILLIGGRDTPGVPLSETLTLEGSSWVPIPTTGWPGLVAVAAVHDAARNVIVVRGPSSTWELSGATWTEHNTPAPPQLFGYRIAYDLERARVITVCGSTQLLSGSTSAILEWDGTTWSVRAPDPLPPARTGATVASDPLRGRMVLFGGLDELVVHGDTWEWDGASWTERLPIGPRPAPRATAVMAYDGVTGEVLLFGGTAAGGVRLDDTWTWNGTRWLERIAGGQPGSPGPRASPAIAYDVRRRRVVLFGGSAATGPATRQDTWEWDGSSWSPMEPLTTPPPRLYAAMTYDVARERVVLQGGSDGPVEVADTWEWDGVTWTQRMSATAPMFRSGHVHVYDRARRRVLNLGGLPDFSTWEWDGANWAQAPSSFEPALLLAHAGAYDDARSETLLFGGSAPTDPTMPTVPVEGYQTTWTGSYRGAVEELCHAGRDHDGDGAIGCADTDCARLCAPACILDEPCTAGPRCGDGACGPLENEKLCPADCTGPAVCGDAFCAPGEACPGDCS